MILVGLAGCPPPPPEILPALPMRQAILRVQANRGQPDACLKAEATATGYLTTDDGQQNRQRNRQRHRFNLDASMQVIAPRHLYLLLRSGLGQKEVILGSNDRKYWIYVRPADTYKVGTHAAVEQGQVQSLPLQPDQVIEAFGLNALPLAASSPQGPYQRVTDRYQQLIFVTALPDGGGRIEKEYWLDRCAPRLIRRIIFRNAIGEVLLDARLDDYRGFEGQIAVQLPYRLTMSWPQHGALIELRVRQWKTLPDRDRSHPAFVPPHERSSDLHYGTMIDLDTGEPLLIDDP